MHRTHRQEPSPRTILNHSRRAWWAEKSAHLVTCLVSRILALTSHAWLPMPFPPFVTPTPNKTSSSTSCRDTQRYTRTKVVHNSLRVCVRASRLALATDTI